MASEKMQGIEETTIQSTSKPCEPSLSWIVHAMSQNALNDQNEKQRVELEKLKISHDFNKKLTELRSLIKPDGENKLQLNAEIKGKLSEIKDYASNLEQTLRQKGGTGSERKEMVDLGKMLSKRTEKIVRDIEKNDLSPEKRKDVREDLDIIIKEISEDNSMQLNTLTRIMNNLHEMYAMARNIQRTDHEAIKKVISKHDSKG